MCSCNQLPSGSPSPLAFHFCWEIILQCCPGKSIEILFEVQFCAFLRRLQKMEVLQLRLRWKNKSWVISCFCSELQDMGFGAKAIFLLADFYSPIASFIKWIKVVYWKTCWNCWVFSWKHLSRLGILSGFSESNFNDCILGEMGLKWCCQNLLATFVGLKSQLLSFFFFVLH